MDTKKAASSISRFCADHDISRPLYYKMRAENKAPKEMRVGRRVLISEEAAADWRRRMEAQE